MKKQFLPLFLSFFSSGFAAAPAHVFAQKAGGSSASTNTMPANLVGMMRGPVTRPVLTKHVPKPKPTVAMPKVPRIQNFDPKRQAYLKAKYTAYFNALIERMTKNYRAPAQYQMTAAGNIQYLDSLNKLLRELFATKKPVKELYERWFKLTAQQQKANYELFENAVRFLVGQDASLQAFLAHPERYSESNLADPSTEHGKRIYELLGELGVPNVFFVLDPSQDYNAMAKCGCFISLCDGLLNPDSIEHDYWRGVLAHEAQHIIHRDHAIDYLYYAHVPHLAHIIESRADIFAALTGPKYFNGLVAFLEHLCVNGMESSGSHPSPAERLTSLYKLYDELTKPLPAQEK